ncbi:MAG TPA: multidrug ABC transporter ATP-binding protein [Bacteroidales bacterium]|nr:multidrug ABC transporter ATP-binding protein [Bacteroidales bacterium]
MQPETEKKKLSIQGLKKLIQLTRFLAPYKLYFFVSLVLLLISGALSLVFPWLTGDLINASGDISSEKINEITLILMGVFIINAGISYFRVYFFAIISQKSVADLRTAVYNRVLLLPVKFFSERRVGDLTARLAADIAVVQETFTTTLAHFIREFIVLIGGLGLMVYISPKLTGFMLALVPAIVITAVIFGKFIRRLSKETQNKVAESNVIAEEALQAIQTVKAFANEIFEQLRYKKAVDDIVDLGIKGAKWRGAFSSFIIFFMFGAIVAIIWFGAKQVQESDTFTIGDLIKFIMYSLFMAGSIGGMADLISQLQKATGAAENLLDLLNEVPEQLEVSSKTATYTGNIQFENVSFNYPGRKDMAVLSGINLSVKSGEKVALVGPSGAGKSTITSLLMHFYQATEGNIKIDDKPIEAYDLHELRSGMAIVPQDILLFGGTIMENIAYGKPGATEAEISEAARKANAIDFIESFPEKFQTLVGERGVQLSGGQRQRIAIARAILKNPQILILDEATGALDSESEKAVQQALETLMEGRSSIIIAHRLSTIKNVDKILVLEKGKIIETGTHAELLSKSNGLFKQLYELQMFE